MTSPKKKRQANYNKLVTSSCPRHGGSKRNPNRFRGHGGSPQTLQPIHQRTKRCTDSREEKRKRGLKFFPKFSVQPCEIFPPTLNSCFFLTYLDEFETVPQPPISERDSLTPRAVEGIFVNQIHPELHILESHICQKKTQWIYFLGMPPG